jgi:hypothetical protein
MHKKADNLSDLLKIFREIAVCEFFAARRCTDEKPSKNSLAYRKFISSG